ncbi:alpha/beta hydrolase-fold protein [Acinetobacter bouvetii]|uniref:Enterochelin esterase n=1 Tax=Acinetobacter bouvetii TaxID=202951 RepID=A0A811GGJ9_9GAMM|nr:alpha/beta hydrolase-fold protein [Acinetobacter bouvetii]CAB1221790.1 Enterochelin esterase [Acinetobacter bouvetii]
MLKSVSVPLLCTAILFSPWVLAESATQTQQQYAAPCEAVIPQSQLLKKIQGQLKSQPQKSAPILNSFWKQVTQHGTPYIEKLDADHSRMIFLWRGAAHNVRLIGGPSNDHEWLTRLPNSDIWFKEAIVQNSFIGSYSFAVDLPMVDDYLSHYCPQLNPKLKESRSQRRAVLQVQKTDPYNPQRFLADLKQNQFRNENIVALAQAPQYINPTLFPHHAQPTLESYTFNSQILKNQRKIQIYQSKRLDPKQAYITAIFFDGEQYAQLLNVPKALDILVEQGKLPPIQAIFVSPPNEQIRPKELTPNPEFSAFFQDELLPWIDAHVPNSRDPQKTVLLGSSLGGLSSAYLALQNPQQISHVVPLSGSFWWTPNIEDKMNGMSQLIAKTPNQPKQHWYISANSYESSRNNNDLSILETSPIVAQDLKAKAHDVTYKNYVGGHSYAIWQVILQDALLHFFRNK